MKFSILRAEDDLPDFRLRSIHTPEKKDNTISAIAEGVILGFSASIFMASRCCKQYSILGDGAVSIFRKDGELPHRLDGKTSLLLPLVKGTVFEKRFDVLLAKRLLGEKPSRRRSKVLRARL